MRLVFLGGVTLAAGGCIFAGSDEVRVSVAVEYTASDTALVGEPRLVNAGGVVQVIHHFDLPTSCYNFTGSARQVGTTVTLTMTQTSGAISGCPTDPSHWGYSALMSGFATEATSLELAYDTDGSVTRSSHAIPPPE